MIVELAALCYASVYLELLGDVYDATGKVEAGINKICMCGQGPGCRGRWMP